MLRVSVQHYKGPVETPALPFYTNCMCGRCSGYLHGFCRILNPDSTTVSVCRWGLGEPVRKSNSWRSLSKALVVLATASARMGIEMKVVCAKRKFGAHREEACAGPTGEQDALESGSKQRDGFAAASKMPWARSLPRRRRILLLRMQTPCYFSFYSIYRRTA